MYTAIKHKALVYCKLTFQRLLFFYHLQQEAVFWGLRIVLAFLLLLLSLSPFVSGPAQAICMVCLAVLGIICFLDKEQETISGQEKQTVVGPRPAYNPHASLQTNKRHKGEAIFQPLNIRGLVFEVNAFAQKKHIARKTIDVFVLPDAYGKRHAIKAIDDLKAAGYAIRLHIDAELPSDRQQYKQHLVGECNGYLQVYITH